MKKLLLSAFLLSTFLVFPVSATNHLTGRTIALDAGHGGGAIGAIGYCGTTPVVEADVNLKVREDLAAMLAADGATVFLVPQLSSRKDRVAAAEEAGAEVLISIHHNGSSDTTVDYTKSFITQGNDKKLATPVHNALVAALGLPDKGIKHDGFGITVYGDIPGVLTEAYFITNTVAACDFIGAKNRVNLEVGAMHAGLVEYFSSGGGDDEKPGGGNGKGKKSK